MTTITLTDPVNLGQLSAEMGGVPLELTGDQLSASGTTEAQLAHAVAQHRAQPAAPVEPPPDPLDELLAAVEQATTVAAVKAALVEGLPRALGRG